MGFRVPPVAAGEVDAIVELLRDDPEALGAVAALVVRLARSRSPVGTPSAMRKISRDR